LGSLSGLGGLTSLVGGSTGSTLSNLFQQGAGLMGSPAGQALAGAAGKAIRKRLAHAMGVGGKAHRHMNPGNFKALRRSLRRLKAFEHAAKRVYSFTHRAPGRAKFKFPKRRRR
jgi:hypothetical protein